MGAACRAMTPRASARAISSRLFGVYGVCKWHVLMMWVLRSLVYIHSARMVAVAYVPMPASWVAICGERLLHMPELAPAGVSVSVRAAAPWGLGCVASRVTLTVMRTCMSLWR